MIGKEGQMCVCYYERHLVKIGFIFKCEANARSDSVMLLKWQLFKGGQGGQIGRRLVRCYCMRAEVHKELEICGVILS